MRAPRKLRVGPATYTVHRQPPRGDDGRFWASSQTIAVSEGMGEDEQADTLLHEVLHACFYQTGLAAEMSEGEQEELIVRRLTPMLLDTLRRNPSLVRAIGLTK